MLKPILADHVNRPLDAGLFVSMATFDFNPSYQRGQVWTTTQKQNLVKTLLQRLPIGVVYLNRRSEMDDTQYVIDGKQRLLAIKQFTQDGFAVPADWFDVDTDEEMMFFSQLTEGEQRRFTRCFVMFYETNLATEDEEKDLYLRINSGGTAHTEEDLNRAR